jgi:hypothetical protein
MATNPLQQMIPQVLRMLQQNPQMMMQLASVLTNQNPRTMQMNRFEERYQPGSGEQNPMPLPPWLTGTDKSLGRAEDVTNDKRIGREIQEQQFSPHVPSTPGLHPEIMPFLEMQRERDYKKFDRDPILEPGEPEPIAEGYSPGLLSRLAEEDEYYGG